MDELDTQARKSPRATFHDYSGGEYFVTICTADKKHYLGMINDGKMHLSPIGQYCETELQNLSKHYPYAGILMYVVMPNHIHAIISIDDSWDNRPSYRSTLSIIIGGFKRAITMFARKNNIEFGWHTRYHDHIIRGNHDGNNIARYIENNVASWDNDCFNT